jgi:hypothetical protein
VKIVTRIAKEVRIPMKISISKIESENPGHVVETLQIVGNRFWHPHNKLSCNLLRNESFDHENHVPRIRKVPVQWTCGTCEEIIGKNQITSIPNIGKRSMKLIMSQVSMGQK